MHDVIVIGAGPGGLTAARLLAERGFDVAVLEEHEDIGRPVHCTGIIAAETFEELDLSNDLLQLMTSRVRLSGPAGLALDVQIDRIHAAVVERAAFDGALGQRAAAAGAVIRCGARVSRLVSTADAVHAEMADGAPPVSARACVLACGASYRFHRPLGLGLPRAFIQSAQLDTDFPSEGPIEIRLGRSTTPGGFAWVVPYMSQGTSRARLGMIARDRARARFASFTSALADQWGLDRERLANPRLKILPLGPVRKTFAPRVLAIGDAAGLVKPTTGGGIYYSILSAGFAADILAPALTHDTLDETTLSAYEARWRERLGPEIRAGLAFRTLAERLDDAGIDALIELARTNGIVPLLRTHAEFNWHRAAALALLKHGAFRRIILSALFR